MATKIDAALASPSEVLEFKEDEAFEGKILKADEFPEVLKFGNKKWREAIVMTAPGHMFSKDSAFAALCCCCCSSRVNTPTNSFSMAVQIEPNLWRSSLALNGLIETGSDQATTIGECFDKACERFSNEPILGTRPINTWAKPKKYWQVGLGPYAWLNYDEVSIKVNKIMVYFTSRGIKLGDIVTIFSETRFEWICTAMACWKMGIVVGTAYANLGVDALCYSVNQMEAKAIVCEASNAKIVGDALTKMPSVATVIYFKDQNPILADCYIEPQACQKLLNKREGLVAVSFESLMKGSTQKLGGKCPTKNDIAVIMYTSGSTGKPKGVMISHANAIATMASFEATKMFGKGESHCAVYPLAHIMEICVELGCISQGMRIGYGTTKTMVTGAPFLAPGTTGDLAELEPTFLLSVPLILDRIKQKVTAGGRSKLGNDAFDGIVDRAKQARAMGTKCMKFKDVLVLNKIRAGLLGTKLKLIICGSAPLSAETEEWASAVLGAPVLQGYAMTESTCSGTLKWGNDFSFGTVGVPAQTVDLKLVDWPEGNYKVIPTQAEMQQTPPIKPGGEILVTGPCVSMGYFKMPAKTAQDFVTDKKGRRWFRTGDVGVFNKWGCLKLIDRKKDIKKLLTGEYISYGKIEPVLKTSSLIDNACVFADSTKKHCFAVVTLPGDFHKTDLLPTDAEVLKSIQKVCKEAGFARFEIPKQIYVEPRIFDGDNPVWNADNNLTTSTFKIKRANIAAHYQDTVARLYTE